MAAVKDFEELAIFQKARELSKKIYPVTNREGFKSDYRFVQQIRAAAGSIMDNIAEGFERTGNKEFINFLYIAKGSCGEVRSQLIRANDVGYLTPEEFEKGMILEPIRAGRNEPSVKSVNYQMTFQLPTGSSPGAALRQR